VKSVVLHTILLMLRSRWTTLLAAIVSADAQPLYAQSTSSALPQSRAFVGVGGGLTNNETGRPRTEDETVYGTESLFMTWIDGGFIVTRRLAVGAEWVWLGTVDVPGGSSRNQLAEGVARDRRRRRSALCASRHDHESSGRTTCLQRRTHDSDGSHDWRGCPCKDFDALRCCAHAPRVSAAPSRAASGI